MTKLSTGCLTLLLLLTGCGSGWHIARSEERTPHFRTLAVVSPEEEDKQELAFAVRKREKSVMAEKILYDDGQASAALTTGRHKTYRWMAGISLHYAF
jgi:hypothetical protein